MMLEKGIFLIVATKSGMMYRCADLDDLLYDADQESGIKGVEGLTEAIPIPELTIFNGSIRVFARTPLQWMFAGE